MSAGTKVLQGRHCQASGNSEVGTAAVGACVVVSWANRAEEQLTRTSPPLIPIGMEPHLPAVGSSLQEAAGQHHILLVSGRQCRRWRRAGSSHIRLPHHPKRNQRMLRMNKGWQCRGR